MTPPAFTGALRILALAAAAFLAGCATPPTGPTAAAPIESGPPPAPGAPVPALIPQGPLRPIASAQAQGNGVASLAAPADLWDRIRRGYAMAELDDGYVRDWEQWYSTRPDYIQRMTQRSSKYLFHIVEELERRDMPAELALLPYIESAFNPQAVSTAKAAGMWQFMPATGSDFQLKQNLFRDDRRDVLASTRAALDYLQRLYAMFGDWHLALAAYNWGQGNVAKAIARNQKAGLPTGYADLKMPDETRNYVPKLQAVKNLVANPQLYAVDLPTIANHPYFQTVEIARDIDVALAARLADVKIDDFKALNPSARQPVILAAGTPQILLPWDNATVFRRNLDAYAQGQYASWTAWAVPATMTVAAAAQRVGMSDSDLRSVNNIPPRMLIKAGSALIVPRSARVSEDVAEALADGAQLSLAPEIVTRRTTVKAGKRDGVASIAARYKLAAAQVAEWNDVKAGASFKPGQAVVLFLPVAVRTARAAVARDTPVRAGAAPAPRATAGSARAPARPAAAPARGKATAPVRKRR